jgi:hypothetical protein
MNAARYRNEILTPCLNQLHDDELVYGYFQQNGGTVHTTGATIESLTEFYNRIISCNQTTGPLDHVISHLVICTCGHTSKI